MRPERGVGSIKSKIIIFSGGRRPPKNQAKYTQNQGFSYDFQTTTKQIHEQQKEKTLMVVFHWKKSYGSEKYHVSLNIERCAIRQFLSIYIQNL